METIEIIPKKYNEEIHDLIIINVDNSYDKRTITYMCVYKKDVLAKELSTEILTDVINKLGDLNGHQTKPIKICTENLVKLSEEQIAKIINKNWTIIQGW